MEETALATDSARLCARGEGGGMVAKPQEMLSFVLAPWEGAHSPGLETLEGERVQVGTDSDLSQEPSVRCGERSPSPGGDLLGW